LTSDHLMRALIACKVRANILHFLNELPIVLIVMAVEEAAQQTGVKPQKNLEQHWQTE
jgi:hypothetical protein